jgi:hypothetical protein
MCMRACACRQASASACASPATAPQQPPGLVRTASSEITGSAVCQKTRQQHACNANCEDSCRPTASARQRPTTRHLCVCIACVMPAWQGAGVRIGQRTQQARHGDARRPPLLALCPCSPSALYCVARCNAPAAAPALPCPAPTCARLPPAAATETGPPAAAAAAAWLPACVRGRRTGA